MVLPLSSLAWAGVRLGRAEELSGCLLKQESEEKCHEALFCSTEGLKRCCAAVIQWGKDKSLTYTYAPPRERTPWAGKEQNMEYEFPRAAQEGWLPEPFLLQPPLPGCAGMKLCLGARKVPGAGCFALPHCLRLQP